ncbi:glycosyltransferase family 2 protein [Bartonella sp. LJL80]
MIIIPARNEQDRIEDCLSACAESIRQIGSAGRILLVINNTVDNTVDIAMSWGEQNSIALDILDVDFPDDIASAGYARALGFDLALSILGPRGVMLTTDADSTVSRNWLAGHLKSAALGAALTCGIVESDNYEHAKLPAWLRERSAIEDSYYSLSRQLITQMDPDPFNPWPYHGDESGANMSISAYAYERIGGSPHVRESEDRALVQRVINQDLSVYYCPNSLVTTSVRLKGRAAGGMAETIANRMLDPDYLCDQRLESADMTLQRAKARKMLRLAMKNDDNLEALLLRLGLNQQECRHAMHYYTFGAMWNFVESSSTLLKKHRMRFSEMQKQLPLLREMVENAAIPPSSNSSRGQTRTARHRKIGNHPTTSYASYAPA